MTTGKTRAIRAVMALRPRRWIEAFVFFLGVAFAHSVQAGGYPEGSFDLDAEIECLALTLYFEARGEPREGKLAVGHVVMNRVADRDYPDTVCGVVQQGGEEKLHRCQFSWWCDGRSDEPTQSKAWEESLALARSVFWRTKPDPTAGAKWYHAIYVKPDWRDHFIRGPQIGQHVFYLSEPADETLVGRPQLAKNR